METMILGVVMTTVSVLAGWCIGTELRDYLRSRGWDL